MSTEIPIWVNGEIRWLSGIDKKTTCRDIVEVLLDGEGIDKAEVKDFTIMERWRKVERPLDENSKILKIWSHWGDEKKEVRLCLRRIDNEVDSGRGSPIGSGSTPSLRRKRNRYRGKPALVHPEGLHPRRLAELSTFHKRDSDLYDQNDKSMDVNDETPTKNFILDQQTHGNYDEIYNDNENVHCRFKKSTAKSYHCPSTGKLHSTPLADNTNSRAHGKRSGKCCSKRDSKHKTRNSESIEKLMKLILAQGATIQSQLQKLKERDEQIEIIEHERHKERIEKNGRNYLLETYLGSLKEAEIPAEMDEERADDSGVNTEGGSDQMNAIKRKNIEIPRQNETEPDSDPGPSGTQHNMNEQESNHRHHHHHHHYISNTLKSVRSKSESRTTEPKSSVAKIHLKRTLSDNSIAKGIGMKENVNKSPNSDVNLVETKEDSNDVVELKKIQNQIHMWEKVFKINKKLEKEEENLVRLHIKIKKIQNENYRLSKEEEEKTSAEEAAQAEKNNEDQVKGTTSQQTEKLKLENAPDQIDTESDYAKMKQNLETLKSDLDFNSKEIYKNFTKLLEEDEIVEHKRDRLTQLLSDLERTQREEEMLNEMITMRESQKPETETASEPSDYVTASAENVRTCKPLDSFFDSGGDCSNVNSVQVPDEPLLDINQRPEKPDITSKKAQTFRPKIVKISFEDSIKNKDNGIDSSQDKSVREPATVPAGALKGILKNRSKSVVKRDMIIYSSNNQQNESQTYPFTPYLNNFNSHTAIPNNTISSNQVYANYHSQPFTENHSTIDSAFRNDMNYSTEAYAMPYNSFNYHSVQNLYEPNYTSVSVPSNYDIKTAYPFKGSHPHDLARTPQPHLPHSTITKTKVPNDNDSSTSSETSGLCSMYSSSPSVEQPYIEHGYILDTLV